MVATMSRAAAIRKAKAEVVLVRTGPIAGGWAGARVNVLDHGYEAWVEGKKVDYATARQRYKEEVVSKALALLGWEPYYIERVLRDSWEWKGRRVEEIIRELMEDEDLNG